MFSRVQPSSAILPPCYCWRGHTSSGGHSVAALWAFVLFWNLFIVDDLCPHPEVSSSELTHLSFPAVEAGHGTVSGTEKLLSKPLLNHCGSMSPLIGPWARRSPCENPRAGEIWGICPSPSRSNLSSASHWAQPRKSEVELNGAACLP